MDSRYAAKEKQTRVGRRQKIQKARATACHSNAMCLLSSARATLTTLIGAETSNSNPLPVLASQLGLCPGTLWALYRLMVSIFRPASVVMQSQEGVVCVRLMLRFVSSTGNERFQGYSGRPGHGWGCANGMQGIRACHPPGPAGGQNSLKKLLRRRLIQSVQGLSFSCW